MKDLTNLLDSVAAFDNLPPFFSTESFASLGEPDAIMRELIAIADDSSHPPMRRYAAAEALFEGPWPSWQNEPSAASSVANALGTAIPHDHIHNRWGLPGHFVGGAGKRLLSLKQGVVQVLQPLLDITDALQIEGSEAAALQDVNRYRISDLAGYLICEYTNRRWEDDPSPDKRDVQIATLRRELP